MQLVHQHRAKEGRCATAEDPRRVYFLSLSRRTPHLPASLLFPNPGTDTVLFVTQENYGRKDPQCEARVKEVYNEIRVEALYFEYEQQAYERLCALIDSIPEEPTLPVTTLHPPHGHNHEDSPTSSAFNTPDQSRSSSPEPEGTVSVIKRGPVYGAMLEPYPMTIPALHGGSGDTVTLKREVFKSFLEKIYKRSK